MKNEQDYTPGQLNAWDEYWDAVSTGKTLLTGRYREGFAAGLAKAELMDSYDQ